MQYNSQQASKGSCSVSCRCWLGGPWSDRLDASPAAETLKTATRDIDEPLVTYYKLRLMNYSGSLNRKKHAGLRLSAWFAADLTKVVTGSNCIWALDTVSCLFLRFDLVWRGSKTESASCHKFWQNLGRCLDLLTRMKLRAAHNYGHKTELHLDLNSFK